MKSLIKILLNSHHMLLKLGEVPLKSQVLIFAGVAIQVFTVYPSSVFAVLEF